jgi:hypothetical protein
MLKTLFSLPFIFFLSGCAHKYYVPPAQNVPLFKEKNELRASGCVGGTSEISTVDAQAAYSFTDRFAAMVNYMHGAGGDKTTLNYGKADYLDAAVGYFKAFDKHGVFEIYGGVGGSSQHHNYQYTDSDFFGKPRQYSGSSDLAFSKVYLQPSIGLTFSGFDIAFTSCISNINFHKISFHMDPNDVERAPLDALSHKRNSFLFEPSLTLRGGWKYVKMQVQLISSTNMSHSDLKFENGKVSLGIMFAFAERLAD